jgi:predicted Zn-dependent protease
MLINKNFLLLILILLQFGCAKQYKQQKPAPVYGHKPDTQEYQSPQAITAPLQTIAPPESKSIEQTAPVVASQSPAVVALLSEADKSSSSGNLNGAVATVERALRIEPRNPELVYKLAELRLEQSKPRLAENLAKKAELLAAGNPPLKKRCWLLIAQAREMQGDSDGAAAARIKANR